MNNEKKNACCGSAAEKAAAAMSDAKTVRIFNIVCISALAATLTLIALTVGGVLKPTAAVFACIAAAAAVFIAAVPGVRRKTAEFGFAFAALWKRLEKRWPTLFEFIRYWLVANVSTIIDYGVTLLMLWIVFAPLQYREFDWSIGKFTVFHYDAGKGMGLAGFLSYVISYVASQIFSFFAQRKYAFRSNNSVAVSAVWFTVVTLAVVFITQFLPQFYMNWLYELVGSGLGSVLIKFFNCCIGLWLMYPINKFIIMKRTEETPVEKAE